MNKPGQISYRHVIIAILLAVAMLAAYFAGTISVEARWLTPGETRATTNQKAAVSAAVSLLLLGSQQAENTFLPLIVK